jgi:hypothetical protein
MELVIETEGESELLKELERVPTLSVIDIDTVWVAVVVGGGVIVELPVKDMETDWEAVADGVCVGVQHFG